MTFRATIIALSLFITGYSQDNCSCQEELKFVIGYYERNLPGFKDNVTSTTKKDYNTFKNILLETSNNAKNKTDCFKVLTRYVEYFKDNHSSIRMKYPIVNEKDSTQLADFLKSPIFTSREQWTLQDKDFDQYRLNDIRGLYQTKSGTYKIAIIPDKTPFRDYIGVIVESKTKLWKKGQVKMELKKKPDSENYEAFVFMRNHSLSYEYNFTFSDGILGENWFKTSLKNKINYATDVPPVFDFKKINDSIAYLKIPTFSGGQSAKIDSLYKASFNTIRSTPYLIIDVRNNGGGSDSNATPLLEFIYTNKIKTDRVDVYVTPDNLKMWERWYHAAKQDTLNYGQEALAWFENEISKQKQAKPNTFIVRSKGKKIIRKYNSNKVKKVAIIYNRRSASSCESLLFWAMQSSKTILVGENSGGYVGYGEIGTIKTPCFNFDLGCTMTRYRKQRKYEATGIPPDYYLTNKKDWIAQTIDLLSL